MKVPMYTFSVSLTIIIHADSEACFKLIKAQKNAVWHLKTINFLVNVIDSSSFNQKKLFNPPPTHTLRFKIGKNLS